VTLVAHPSALERAVELLVDSLAAGPRPAAEMVTLAASGGVSPATLRRARREAGVVKLREGFGRGGRWLLALPGPIDAQAANGNGRVAGSNGSVAPPDSRRRFLALAAESGLSPGELRRLLHDELDRAARAHETALTAADRRLFEGDPGYIGPGPRTASARQRKRP
jgi:hypothetical protein